MAFTVDERHHVGFVDRGVGLGQPMLVERFLRGPMLHEHEPSRLGIRVIDIESQAAGLRAALPHRLGEVIAFRQIIGWSEGEK